MYSLTLGELIITPCELLVLIVSIVAAEDHHLDHVQQVREWSAWFNTDSPSSGAGDDESLASIRKRGFSVCDDDTPVDAVCRLADAQSVVFNVGTKTFTDDVLVIPCTSIGIVCRNKDQGANRTCKDYGIRFQCLSVSGKDEPVNNLGLIGIAAGLSVIVPILCVTCMHVTRIIKERNSQRNQPEDEESSEGSGASISGDLPPSYSALFGDSGGSTEQLLSDASSQLDIAVIDENGDIITRRHSVSTTSSDAERSGSGHIYSIPNSPRFSRRLSFNSPGAQVGNVPQGRRYPGMHLSIIDLILARQDSNSDDQDSCDRSYIQTPPPTYKEAMIILGGVPFKSSDAESCISDSDRTDDQSK